MDDNPIHAAVARILAARPTFQIGDRVRVLARHECEFCGDEGDQTIDVTGWVEEIDSPDTAESLADAMHPYYVEFDAPIIVVAGFDNHAEPLDGGYFAATELELEDQEACNGSSATSPSSS